MSGWNFSIEAAKKYVETQPAGNRLGMGEDSDKDPNFSESPSMMPAGPAWGDKRPLRPNEQTTRPDVDPPGVVGKNDDNVGSNNKTTDSRNNVGDPNTPTEYYDNSITVDGDLYGK